MKIATSKKIVNSSPLMENEKALEKSPQDIPAQVEETKYPPRQEVILVSIALYLSVLLVALVRSFHSPYLAHRTLADSFKDRTIIGTAIPTITDEFHSLADVGWYGSAYLLTACAFQLLFGKIYTFYSPKWVFLIAIGLFELGSVVCGAAPNSKAFIVGRAVAGLGSAGVISGAIIIIVYLVPLHKRPAFQGLIGACFGTASVLGPVLGGAFTTNVSWRWCFYINLPIGAVTVAIILIILKLPNATNENQSIRQQFIQLDPLGTFFFLPCVVCLLLALQWGGSTYPWNSARIIALLVLFGVLAIGFVAIQIWKQEAATVPPHIIKKRSISGGAWFSICIGASLQVMVYYLPIWFQAVKGVSPVKSGIDNIPLVLSLVFASIFSGGLVQKIGYYTPLMLFCAAIMSVGAGLITTFKVDTGHAKWIGYQVIYGFGLGLGMQQSSIAAQTVLSKQDVPVGASLMIFAQSLGGAIFISVGQSVFTNRLASGLDQIPGINPQALINAGATNLRSIVTPQQLDSVLVIYNQALTRAFDVALGVSCAAILGALAVEWKSVKKVKEPSPAEKA